MKFKPIIRSCAIILTLVATFGCHAIAPSTATAAEYFVDAKSGSDSNPGSIAKPFQTIAHSLAALQPGDTLYLREGVYREEVAIRLHGTAEKPITIAGYKNEKAVIDPAIEEFQTDTANAWVPYTGEDAGPNEYRSAKRYPNQRNFIGSLADTMYGLQTYYYAMDLRAEREVNDWIDWDNREQSDLKPIYCGPGVWYDDVTGYIHARLAHTNIDTEPNYKGETDPRKTPLILSSFDTRPLHISGAKHIKLKNLTIRGGGYDTINIIHCDDIHFEDLTIYCTSYGLRAESVTNFKMIGCDMVGNAAPWTFRSDVSKRAYPHRPWRDITRLNTHALIVTDNGREFGVFATPVNDHWEIAHCRFIDAHDGLYLGGVGVNFHHNHIDNMQDDGIYLSQMYPRHIYGQGGATLHVNNNMFTRCLTALAFGGMHDTKDEIFIYRNLFDMRGEFRRSRGSSKNPGAKSARGKVMGDHGSPPWPAMNIYQNTVIIADYGRRSSMAFFAAVNTERPRNLFNNILYHGGNLPSRFNAPPNDRGLSTDGNLYWAPNMDEKKAAGYLNRYLKSPDYEASKQLYEAGNATHSVVAEPMFQAYSPEPQATNDYRLKAGSPAIGAGIVLPAEWADPYRPEGGKRPDIGAFQSGADVTIGPQR